MIRRADSVGRVPGREPGPDGDAAAAEAATVLRPGHRGGDRPSGAHPGRHGASLPAAGGAASSRSTGPSPSRRKVRADELMERLWRAAVPGAGHAGLAIEAARLHAGRGRPACAGPWPPSVNRARSDEYQRQVRRTAWSAAAIQRDFAERCFAQIEGFGHYGFPESHAASFAQLGLRLGLAERAITPTCSARPCSTAQPMGFYQPAQIGPRRHRAWGL
ncbi:hypothetical protein ACRAWD_11345 [Caulobacter segnis]